MNGQRWQYDNMTVDGVSYGAYHLLFAILCVGDGTDFVSACPITQETAIYKEIPRDGASPDRMSLAR